MKSIIVPAEITSVKDKIGGYLTLTQVLILISGLFTDFIIFVVMPEFLQVSVYKLVAIVFISIIIGALAVPYKDDIALAWLICVLKYSLRPRLYIYDVNDTYTKQLETKRTNKVEKTKNAHPHSDKLNPSSVDLLRLKRFEHNNKLRLGFKTTKEGLSIVSNVQQ